MTDAPFLLHRVSHLAALQHVRLHTAPDHAPPGSGPPALVLAGRDRLDCALPSFAPAVPRLLLTETPPDDGLLRSGRDLGFEQVVQLPAEERLLGARLARLDPEAAPTSTARTIAVIGGCGGAGASVLAAALARTAAQRASALLVEVDQLGAGADLLLGAEDEPGLRWPDLGSARGRLLPGSLSDALPTIDGLHVLATTAAADPGGQPIPGPAMAAVLDAARSEFATVVLDLPRHLDEAAGAAVRSADVVLVVLPIQLFATASARRLSLVLRPMAPDLRLVLRGPAAGKITPESIRTALGLPLAGLLRSEPRLTAALERGEPPGLRSHGPLARLCRVLLDLPTDPGSVR